MYVGRPKNSALVAVNGGLLNTRKQNFTLYSFSEVSRLKAT